MLLRVDDRPSGTPTLRLSFATTTARQVAESLCFSSSFSRVLKAFSFGRTAPSVDPALRAGPPESRDESIRSLLHDLNNVLAVVIGNLDEQLEVIERGEADEVAKLKQLAEESLGAALRGADLIRKRSGVSNSSSGINT
jgi:hypothetical protein